MWIDVLSVVIRALSFIALLQAVGAALFLVLFGNLPNTRGFVAGLARWSAVFGAALVIIHHALDAGRMAGELRGVFDVSLQYLSLTSSSALANGCRLLGALLIAFGVGTRGSGRNVAVCGAALICFSFVLTGHTTVDPHRWLLAGLLFVHVAVVAFWFGALLPLAALCTREAPPAAGAAVSRFSRLATESVPCIALAGLVMASVLLPNLQALFEPYGLSLLAKLLLFSMLMGLAGLNKWRYGPAVAGGNAQSLRAFRLSLRAEFILICAALAVTAAMTTFFSPLE